MHSIFYEIHKSHHGKERGIIALLIVMVVLFVASTLAISVVFVFLNQIKITRNIGYSYESIYAAEAGIEDAIYRIKNAMNVPASYTMNVGGASADITVDFSNSNERIIIANGKVRNVFRKLETRLTLSNDVTPDFFYGIQVGEDGVNIRGNDVTIIGNIFSNGNIQGNTNFRITGDAIVAGGSAPTTDQEWTVQNDDFIFGTTVDGVNQYDAAQSFRISQDEMVNKITLYVRKVGSPSDITIQINKDKSGRPGEKGGDVLTSGTLFASLVTGSYGWVDIALASAPVLDDAETYWIVADATDDPSNYWEWGYDTTNAYPNGEGKYNTDNWNKKNDWNDVGGDLNFKVWLGGVTTFIDQATIGIDVRANTITNSTICGDAYYASTSTIDASSKNFLDSPSEPMCSDPLTPGTGFPDQPDTAPGAWSISDGNIAVWKAEAAAGTLITGDYTININETKSLGPAKITGSLIIDTDATLIVTGTLWVEGEIDAQEDATINLDVGYGANSGVIISDGTMHYGGDAGLAGSPDPASFILFVVLATGGTHHDMAIDFHEDTRLEGIVFAPNGGVRLHKDVWVNQLSAKFIEIDAFSVVQYDSGLINLNFSSGPGAGWGVASWIEVE